MAKCEGCDKSTGKKAVTDIKRSQRLAARATKRANALAARGELAKPRKSTKKAQKKPAGKPGGGGKPCNCGKLRKPTIKVPKVKPAKVRVPKMRP